MGNYPTPESQAGFAPRLRWAVWLVALAGYTYLLVVPNDWLPPWLQIRVSKKITTELTFGKLAHVASYAILTAGTFLLPIGWTGWAVCAVGMSLHGFGTEYVQTFTGRQGCWSDVGIDHIGIVAGLLLGGLAYRMLGGRGPERVSAAPQVQSQAGGDNQDTNPL